MDNDLLDDHLINGPDYELNMACETIKKLEEKIELKNLESESIQIFLNILRDSLGSDKYSKEDILEIVNDFYPKHDEG